MHPSEDRGALLAELHELGRQTHVGLVLPVADFSEAVLARVSARLQRGSLEATPRHTGDMLRTTSGADLYLVMCCDHDMPGAWERLTQAYEPRVRKLALHLGCRDVDALSTDLFGDLSGPAKVSFARTRLGTYLGAGTLFAWLGEGRVTGWGGSQARAARPRPRLLVSRVSPTPPDDPLEHAMVDELAGRLRDLLHVAWETLDDQERRVLLFKYREGLGQRTIASVLGLSESRISRIVSQALTRIRTTLAKQLQSEHPDRWADQDRTWQALMHVVAIHLSEAGPVEQRDETRGAHNG